MSIQQGYLTSEPLAVEKEAGFVPQVFLLADNGYEPYSTTIETMKPWYDANKDVAKRFVEATIIGWYHYLYGDNTAANGCDSETLLERAVSAVVERLGVAAARIWIFDDQGALTLKAEAPMSLEVHGDELKIRQALQNEAARGLKDRCAMQLNL